jgi:hypothetical protein
MGRARVREYGLPLFKAHGRTVHAGPAAIVTKKCHVTHPQLLVYTVHKAVGQMPFARRYGRAYSRRTFAAYVAFGTGDI